MDSPNPFPRDELTELERRLSGWTPAATALDRDRMLFEAGRASARNGAWGRPTTALAAGLAALAVGLGGWAASEHGQRRALERALVVERSRARESALAERLLPPALAPIPVDTPAPESYLVLTRRLGIIGPDEPEPPPAPAVRDPRPEAPDRTLTPLSARRPGGLVDL
jgi:hypothetical protein